MWLLCLTLLGQRSLDLRMIRERVIHDSHLRLSFRQIGLGNDLGHLLLVDLTGIIQIIDIVTKVEVIVNCMAKSAMEGTIF